MGFFDSIARFAAKFGPSVKSASEGVEKTILGARTGAARPGSFKQFSRAADAISSKKNLGVMPEGYVKNILGNVFGSTNNTGIFNRNITRSINTGIMSGVAGAALGGGMGLLGKAVAPDLVDTQSPFKSAFYGALAGAGLGISRGVARGVQMANKSAIPWIDKGAQITKTVADSKVTRGALFAATFAGSIDVGSSVQPYNRNRRA